MSAIVAVQHRDGRPVEAAAVWTMLRAAPYRGPDGLSVHHWETGALGHARMVMTPEDVGERQPLVSPRTGCTIVTDARLDNREELLAQLPGSLPAAVGDAEILLRAYEAWDVDALPRLLGDFAFLLWDPRRRRLLGGRDTSGQRSLYYRIDARTFAAASEIQQLLQDPATPVAPDGERILDFLTPRAMHRNEKDQARTFFAGIQAVPAGHLLTVDAGGARLRRYWDLAPRELRYRRDDDYAEHYRDLLFDAVRSRLRSIHPVGALLSGGLDSASVVAAAQDLYRRGRAVDRGFRSFSAVFDGLRCDERDLVGDLRARHGFAAEFISCGSYGGRLEAVPRGFREAPNMGIGEARDAIVGAASRAGVRALLTGDLADGCVGGSRAVFDSLLRRGRLGAFSRHLRAYRRGAPESWRRFLGFYVVTPLLPMAIQRRLLATYTDRAIGAYGPLLVPPWIPEPLRTELSDRHRRLCVAAECRRRYANPGRQMEYDTLYPPEIARHPVPWSLEFWRPFADRRLHEFLLAIPPEQKFDPHPESGEFYAGSKQVARRAMRGLLPESIRARTSKTVFNDVFVSEVRRQWAALAGVFGGGRRSHLAEHGYIDQARFWARLQTLREGKEGADTVYVMQVIGLESWLRALTLPRPQLVTIAAPLGAAPPAAPAPEACLAAC